MEKFIILTTPRTGSTFLRLWLNNHPNIRCHGEIFLRSYNAKDGFRAFVKNKWFYYLLYAVFGNRLLSRVPGNVFLSFLLSKYFGSLYYDKNHSAPWVDTKTWNDYHKQDPDAVNKALGFKVMLNHIEDYYPLRKIFDREGYKIIILTRENILKACLSSILLKRRQVAHSVENQEAIKLPVNPGSLIRMLKKQEKDKSKLHSLFSDNQVTNVTYEGLFRDDESAFCDILDFIGVSSENIKRPDLKKINPSDIKNIVSNYGEIKKALGSYGYDKFLN